MCCFAVDKVKSQWDSQVILLRAKAGVLATDFIARRTYWGRWPFWGGRAQHVPLTDDDCHCALFRRTKFFEGMDNAQIEKIVKIATFHTFEENEKVICQGEKGHHFFLVISGELAATVAIGNDVQEHRRYSEGDLFGERSLSSNKPRAASVIAKTRVELLSVSRKRFEMHLGPMSRVSQFHEEHYLLDPRKIIADFFMPGDTRGPKGALHMKSTKSNASVRSNGRASVLEDVMGLDMKAENSLPANETSSWFAVYRPTSRDAIALMLQRIAVGKGLNVKGKSAKTGVLSGFVPFVQISENRHKQDIETSPPKARVQIYYASLEARSTAQAALQAVLDEAYPSVLDTEDPMIYVLDGYLPKSWGLNIPECLLVEAYIMRANIRPPADWVTGRASEPAFMNMNLHTARGDSVPKVVILQFDSAEPMNPCGLLVAYAEQSVKAVVSDFDTFIVGSRNMPYEPLPAEQLELAKWSLARADELLDKPILHKGWTHCWLDIVTKATREGFYPHTPPCGFGDPTSYRIIEDVIAATLSCGAVRHGAECFNFWFPQELDLEYLVIWEHFTEQPWEYMSEPQLRAFLLNRALEGFCFPLNPVWPVRDEGWNAVLKALLDQCNSDGSNDAYTVYAWYPRASGILDRIEEIIRERPDRLQWKASSKRSALKPQSSDLEAWENAELGMYRAELARQQLLKEIANGKSQLTLASDGSMLRIVSVVVLHLESEDERVLVQVWDSATDFDRVRYRLPAKKLNLEDTPMICIENLMTTKLGLMVSEVRFLRDEKRSVAKKSFRFECKTQYDRYIFHAALSESSLYKTPRLTFDDAGHLVYEVDNQSGRRWVRLVADGPSPLEERVQAIPNEDSVFDVSSGCELFAYKHTEDEDRVTVFAWMEADRFAALGEGYLPNSPSERIDKKNDVKGDRNGRFWQSDIVHGREEAMEQRLSLQTVDSSIRVKKTSSAPYNWKPGSASEPLSSAFRSRLAS